MAEGWELVAETRREVADLVEGLSQEQRDGPTLCGEWTPHIVLGHLVVFVDMALPKFMFSIMKAKGDYDTAADRMARAFAQRPVEDLAATLRERAAKKSAMPGFPPELSLADVTIHTQDIRRGQDLGGTPSEQVLGTTLDFLTSHKQAKNLFDPSSIDGLELVATDMDWRSGSGDEISGPAEALMMAITGRPVLDELSGATDRLT